MNLSSSPVWLWFTPAISALVLYGLGQGLVKKWISDIPPALFCIYFVFAKAIVNLSFYFTQTHPPLTAAGGLPFLTLGVLAYIWDGLGWIFYFQSILLGPITIVGTLSAAYPALTVVFGRVFLGETLLMHQYAGVIAVVVGCLGLAYSPPDSKSGHRDSRWILLSVMALILWAGSQTLVKYSYGLPQASEVNLALCNTLGGALTLGVYGILKGRGHRLASGDWIRSLLPMGMMAGGDLGVIIANRFGPISLVTPITGAYPLVTLGFAALVLKEAVTKLQWLCILFILIGMYLVSLSP